MSQASRCRAGAAALALYGAIACSEPSDEGEANQGGSAGDDTVSCRDDPRLDVYTDNMDKPGELGVLTFRFSDFEPAPPAKGSNTFHVQASDANGLSVTGSLGVGLTMPDHGHGTSVKPLVTLDAATSTYSVTPLYLFMPGVWRIEFDAAPVGSESMPLDRVTLHFCVEG